MRWCELNGVDYLFGLAKNPRLNAAIVAELEQARRISERTGRSARRFKDFMWATLDSWSGERRIALNHTQFAKAAGGTIRHKLFKIGALVRVSIRRIKIAMASGCSLPGRVRPGPCAAGRRGALTTRRTEPTYSQPARGHRGIRCACGDSLRLRPAPRTTRACSGAKIAHARYRL